MNDQGTGLPDGEDQGNRDNSMGREGEGENPPLNDCGLVCMNEDRRRIQYFCASCGNLVGGRYLRPPSLHGRGVRLENVLSGFGRPLSECRYCGRALRPCGGFVPLEGCRVDILRGLVNKEGGTKKT